MRLLLREASRSKLALRGLMGGRLPTHSHNIADSLLATTRFAKAIRKLRAEKKSSSLDASMPIRQLLLIKAPRAYDRLVTAGERRGPPSQILPIFDE